MLRMCYVVLRVIKSSQLFGDGSVVCAAVYHVELTSLLFSCPLSLASWQPSLAVCWQCKMRFRSKTMGIITVYVPLKSDGGMMEITAVLFQLCNR